MGRPKSASKRQQAEGQELQRHSRPRRQPARYRQQQAEEARDRAIEEQQQQQQQQEQQEVARARAADVNHDNQHAAPADVDPDNQHIAQDKQVGNEGKEQSGEEEEEHDEDDEDDEDGDSEEELAHWQVHHSHRARGRGRGRGRGHAPTSKKAKTDPVVALLPALLSQLAPDFDKVLAEDTLRELLSQSPGLEDNPTQWLDDALLRLACCQEVHLETDEMRAAMAASLLEAQEARKKQEAEEERENKVVATRRKYPNSDILSQLSTLVCPALLLSTSAQPAIVQLLDLEKNCKKWYPGRGTNTYFSQLASSQASDFKSHLDQALRDSHLPPHQFGAAPSPHSGPSSDVQPAATGASTLQRLPVQPMLCCLQPPSSCPLCGAGAAASGVGTGRGDGAGPSKDRPQEGSGADAVGSGATAGVRLEDCPLLLQFFQFLSVRLGEKHDFIQTEIAKMPEEGPSKKAARGAADANSARTAATHATVAYVPSIFHVAPDVSNMEVVECFSDDEG